MICISRLFCKRQNEYTGCWIMSFDFTFVLRYLPELLWAAFASLKIIGASLAIGVSVGLLIAIAARFGNRILTLTTTIYIEIFRTTPALLQILWIYLALPAVTGIDLKPIPAASIALGLNTSAFLAEILKSGFNAVPRAQYHAADVLGFSAIDKFRFIILPQVVRYVFPPTIALLVTTVKYSSLAAGIGALELTRVGQLIATENLRLIEALTAVAVIYFLMAYPFAVAARRLEKRLRAGMY